MDGSICALPSQRIKRRAVAAPRNIPRVNYRDIHSCREALRARYQALAWVALARDEETTARVRARPVLARPRRVPRRAEECVRHGYGGELGLWNPGHCNDRTDRGLTRPIRQLVCSEVERGSLAGGLVLVSALPRFRRHRCSTRASARREGNMDTFAHGELPGRRQGRQRCRSCIGGVHARSAREIPSAAWPVAGAVPATASAVLRRCLSTNWRLTDE